MFIWFALACFYALLLRLEILTPAKQNSDSLYHGSSIYSIWPDDRWLCFPELVFIIFRYLLPHYMTKMTVSIT